MTLQTGEHLGPYEIVEPLGAGGMGEVYRARDTRLDREVAVKVLPEHLAEDTGALARFEREAKAVAALSHPNILAIHDVGTAPPASPLGKGGQRGVSYVVMELLEGETLRERLRGAALSWHKAAEIGGAIADGLAAAHVKGIIHRDLKPDNIFLTKDGVVKILDFGLARMERAASPKDQADLPTITVDTKPGAVMGTPAYMSPEQVRGEAADARSDIFAFGCVLYEMVTGNRAFARKTPAEITAAILKEEPPDITETAKGVPPEFDRVIRHCVEKKPEDRFQSARDLAFSLKEVSTLRGTFMGRFPARPESRSRIRSVVVLPLVNLSGDVGQEYFADGMTEALITDLAKIGVLRVISRTSAMQYKGTRKPLPEIAQELNVEAVVEGSVLRVGGRVRITAQLIDAATDRHLWAESYERDLCDILHLQSEVARAIAKEIRIKLTPHEEARLATAKQVDPQAHEAYLKGRHWLNKRTEEGLKKSAAYCQQAIEIDADYALAHAGLAMSYTALAGHAFMRAEDAFSKAKAAALRSLELDDTIAEAHVALATLSWENDRDSLAAEREYTGAIELDPGSADSRKGYAEFLAASGRVDEAITQMQQARERDPLSLIVNATLGFMLYLARRYDQALEQYREVLEIEPNFIPALGSLGFAYLQKGMYGEATGKFRAAVELSQRAPVHVATLAYAYAVAGMDDEARRLLSELKERLEQAYVPSLCIGLVYTGLDERDSAFDWLKRACRERFYRVLYLGVDPVFDTLRSDPRFDSLLREIGLQLPDGADGQTS